MNDTDTTTTILARAVDDDSEVESLGGAVPFGWYRGALPASFQINTTLYYDNSLLEHFGTDEKVKLWLERVMEFSQVKLSQPSLNIHLKLKVENKMEVFIALLLNILQILNVSYINDMLQADVSSIKNAANMTEEIMGVKSFFFHGIGKSTKGIAMVGGACRRDGFAVNINSFWTEDNSELNTARVWVHELGHQVTMEKMISILHSN